MMSFSNVEDILNKHLPTEELSKVKNLFFGRSDDCAIKLDPETMNLSEKNNFEVRGFSFAAQKEELRPPRIVRVGAVQHSIVRPTTDKIADQRDAIHEKIKEIIKAAAASNVNIICLQEAWTMPLAFCTREKQPWCEFAEDAETGPTTVFLKTLARKYNMVIVSPILERDSIHGETIWNTAVVIANDGEYLGKHRKNHIPRVSGFNESTYYMEGNTGHPVFETAFGKIAINICYGRHHPQNWMMFGINGAEIVFNPSASTCGLIEPLWGIEARNAAVTNNYYTISINRVGTEYFANEFTTGNGKGARNHFGPFYGSSYATAPDGCRTLVDIFEFSLSRDRDGLLIVEMDLNLCRQLKDNWGFRMTQRLDEYGRDFVNASKLDFVPQVITRNSHVTQ